MEVPGARLAGESPGGYEPQFRRGPVECSHQSGMSTPERRIKAEHAGCRGVETENETVDASTDGDEHR